LEKIIGIKKHAGKVRKIPFPALFKFYQNLLEIHLIQILSRFYPNSGQNFDKIWINGHGVA
jgi:hypothetical protein